MLQNQIGLIAFLLTLAIGIPGADGQLSSLPWSLDLTDGTCAATDCNRSVDGCSSQNFTVPAQGVPYLKVSVTCPDGSDCHNCRACVQISENGQVLANCHTANDCSGGSCMAVCTPAGTELFPGHTYTLSVCLAPCDYVDCTVCSANCTARGVVYFE